MKHIKGLDALRACAVLLVIRQHWGPAEFNSVPFSGLFFQKVLPSGTFAVNFFFVLSGFLISNILIQSGENVFGRAKLIVLKNFIIRRSLRIFPIYFILLFCLYLFGFGDVREHLVYYATYTSNFLFFRQSGWGLLGHTWSLAVEEQFYLIWPFVVIFTPRRFLLKVILAFILISTAADLITGSIYGYFSMALPFNCFNAFAIGSLYSYVRLGEKEGILIRKALILLLPVALILYVLSKAAISLVPQRLVDAIIAVNLLMYVTEARYGKVAGFIIDNKMLNNLGRISYGVYLYHYIIPPCYYSILAILEKKIAIPVRIHTLLNHPGMVEMISFSVLITLSYLSYHLIEVKFLKVKKYFKYSEVNAVSAVDVPSVT